MLSLPRILLDQIYAITPAILATELMHFNQFDGHFVGRKVPHTTTIAIDESE